MKIAHIAPLTESVPPRGYGGIERVVSYLVEEQVRLGHQVTLFASGDSSTSAELVPCCRRALGYDPDIRNPFPFYRAMLDTVRRRAQDFDVLHFHFDFLHFLALQDCPTPMVTTLHGWPYLLDLLPFYSCCAGKPLISISLQQRQLLPQLNWAANVYHGLPPDLYPYASAPKEDYLAFVGRLCSEKGPDEAIAIARMAGMRLRIAGNVKREDRAYFEKYVAPHIDGSFIEYIGEVNDREKAQLLTGARASLFPIRWPEPFGLVLIESMACGTPVIAYRWGSTSEVVDAGVTGFVVETAQEAALAVGMLPAIDRANVRRRFEERFSLERMVGDYLSIYRKQVEEHAFRGIRKSGHTEQPADKSLNSGNSRVDPRRDTMQGMTRRLWLRMEFDSGRSYARDRASSWGWSKRILYIGGAPLIPLVRMIRVLRQLIRSGASRALSLQDKLLAPVGLIFSAFGEMAGYFSRKRSLDAN
jgi:glycosyltransferase involved in cell wall biosynthesis